VTIKITFGIAHAGWLPVAVVAEGRQFDFSVSYTPNDFLSELVGALSGTLTCDGTYVATINEEPVVSNWTFRRASDTVGFSIVTYPGWNARSRSRKLLEQSGKPSAIVLPFWRALRELELRQEAQHFEAQWLWPFPLVELEKLTAHVRQLKG
jgi:hypothetical protein